MGCGSASRTEYINIKQEVYITDKAFDNLINEKNRYIHITLIEVLDLRRYNELKVIRCFDVATDPLHVKSNKESIYKNIQDTFRDFEYYLPNIFSFIANDKSKSTTLDKMQVVDLVSNEPLQVADKVEYLIPAFQQKLLNKVRCDK